MASTYKVEDLLTLCEEVLQTELTNENALLIFQHARRFGAFKLEVALIIISKYAKLVHINITSLRLNQ